MEKQSLHQHHDHILRRLKRADGHLHSIIQMIEGERPCVEIAQQLHAVEKAITQAKRTLIQDHIDHCLGDALRGLDKKKNQKLSLFTEFKDIANVSMKKWATSKCH